MASKTLTGVMEWVGKTGKYDVSFTFHPGSNDFCYFAFKPSKGKHKRNRAPPEAPNRQVFSSDNPEGLIHHEGGWKLPLEKIQGVDSSTDHKNTFEVTTTDNKKLMFKTSSKKVKNNFVQFITKSKNDIKLMRKEGGNRKNPALAYTDTAKFNKSRKKDRSMNGSFNERTEQNMLSNFRSYSSVDLSRTGTRAGRRAKTMRKRKEQQQLQHSLNRQENSTQTLLTDGKEKSSLLERQAEKFDSETQLEAGMTKENLYKHQLGLDHIPPPPPPAPKNNSSLFATKKLKTRVKQTIIKSTIGKETITLDPVLQFNKGRLAIMPMKEDEANRERGKSEDTRAFLGDVIANTHSFKTVILGELDAIAKRNMISKMFKVSTLDEDILLTKGQQTKFLYILEGGRVEMFIPDDPASKVKSGRGAIIGTLQFPYGAPTPLTVVCTEACEFWALSKRDYDLVVAEHSTRVQKKRIDALRRVEAFRSFLTDREISSLAAALDTSFKTTDQVLLDYGEPLDKLYFLLQGELHFYKEGGERPVFRLDQLGHYGEIALFEKKISEFKIVVADPKTVLFELKVEEFEAVLGNMKNKMFSKIEKNLQKDLKEYSPKKVQTKVELAVEKVRATHAKLKTAIPAPPKSAIKSILSLVDYDLGGSTYKESDVTIDNTTYVSTKDGTYEFTKAPALLPLLKFSDLEVIENINEGSFGKVFVARARCPEKTEKLKLKGNPKAAGLHNEEHAPRGFALKVMSRYYIEHHGWDGKVDNELLSMAEVSYYCNSPFVLKLYHSYCCPKFIYLLLEYGEGGDLYQLVQGMRDKDGNATRRFSERKARYYIASVVNGLAVLHERKIMYRDLKPENLILNAKGHLKVADLGLAKKAERAYTNCGTAEYTAPEVIRNKGHDRAVDWWALGILVFELHYGSTPFVAEKQDTIHRKIVEHRSPVAFYDPANPPKRIDPKIGYLKGKERLSARCRDLVANLLVPKAQLRLGYKVPGVDGIRNHEYFQHQHFSWEKLERLTQNPPLVVQVEEEDKIENLQKDSRAVLDHKAKTDRSDWEPCVNSVLKVTPRV